MDEDDRTSEGTRARHAEERAIHTEVRRSMAFFAGLAGCVALLIALAWTKTQATWPDAYLDRSQSHAGGAGYWRESLWAILLLLMAGQVIAVLLVAEQSLVRRMLRWVVVWLLRLAVIALVAGAFWWHLPDTWTEVTYDALWLELAVLVVALLVATRPLLHRPQPVEPPAVQPFPVPDGKAEGL